MDISIIIPSYNRNAILLPHLAVAYSELAGLDYEIIVINDSKQSSIEIPEGWADKIKVLNNPKQGVASARNLGAAAAKGEDIVFVDDDMIISRAAVLRTKEFLAANKNACLNVDWVYPDELRAKLEAYSFGRYLGHYGFISLQGWMGKDYDWRDNAVVKASGITSQFLAMTKADFIKSGGYNENFPFAGFEDHDFAVALERAGIIAFLDTTITIRHDETDRVMLDGWLQRKYRSGYTRRIAVDMGYKELVVDYNNVKGTLYFIISKMELLFTAFLQAIPNKKVFDPLYFRIVNILLGIKLYQGYIKAAA